MAQYDDWVYERGLEDEDWVHDRWGDDDYDDDWEENGRNEEMEITNRYSFVKLYTENEKKAIDARFEDIIKEMKDLRIGPSFFKLNNEVVFVYSGFIRSYYNTSYHVDIEPDYNFIYRDLNESNFGSNCFISSDHLFSAKIMFIDKWDRELCKELTEAKKEFDAVEKTVISNAKSYIEEMEEDLEL